MAMSFDILKEAVKQYLSNKLSVNVDFGKVGEMPAETPVVLLYVEPEGKAVRNANVFAFDRAAKFYIFSCCGNKTTAHENTNDAVKLAEEVEQHIKGIEDFLNSHSNNINDRFTKITGSEEPLDFDGYYADVAVVKLEFLITYSPYYEK